jgi:hypothetical protein
MNPKNDNDYYKFVISTGGTITITLGTLPANYQLALLNSGGTVLQSSINSGTASETINSTVTAGTYYARVYPANKGAFNASICYTLRVQTGTASKSQAGKGVAYVSNKFTVSPNPAGYSVNLAFNATVAGNAAISVTNQTGSVVLSKILSVNKGDNTRTLDVSNLATGSYFIKIQTGSVIQTAKLVIAR